MASSYLTLAPTLCHSCWFALLRGKASADFQSWWTSNQKLETD